MYTTSNDITQITMITTTLMMPVFRFSYLHSHRGQNSDVLFFIISGSPGKMTPSQLLKIVKHTFVGVKNHIFFSP